MKYLFLNHKMNYSKEEIDDYWLSFPKLKNSNIEVVVFPSTIYLLTNNIPVMLGSQNVSNYLEGSYTGEISAKQLASLNIKYALVGHSERRKYFHETNHIINEKIKRLQEQQIIPILCIGEEKKELREETLKLQIQECLKDIDLENIIIAYEPIYSIGTGYVLENSEIETTIDFIRQIFKENYQKTFPILYGGSVNTKNIRNLAKISNISGFLIGKASLNTENVKMMLEELK